MANPDALLSSLDVQAALSAAERHTVSVANIGWLRQHTQSLRHAAPVAAGSVGKEQFDGTQRDRGMFKAGGGAASHESYASELFAGAANPEIIRHIAEGLDGKTILNLGGGNAKLANELRKHGARAHISNVEPYPSDRALADPESDPIILENPAESGFFEKSGITPHGIDEIWAVFSVPAYLGTPDEVTTLFDKVKTAHRPGGIARIGHLGFVGGDADDPRLETLFAQLELAAGQGFLVEPVETKARGVITLIMSAPEADMVDPGAPYTPRGSAPRARGSESAADGI